MEQLQGTIRHVEPIRPAEGIMSRLTKLWTREAKEKTVYDLEIKFHRDCAGERSHGQLLVTCKDRGLENRPIAFAFVGLKVAPLMTPDVVYHIWNQAIEQGYVPHGFYSYKAMTGQQ